MLEKYQNLKPFSNSMNYGLFDAVGSIIGSMFNYGATQATNITNSKINDDNLNYQRERNYIEDERYAEETAYNRAFAEDERDYERALQQQIFEREDTSILRQAEQLASLGINPASQQLNGVNAGQALSPASAPSASGRGGEALHNDFQAQAPHIDLRFGDLLDEVNTLDNLNTRGIQRDLLKQQEAKQRLDNQAQAIENLIKMNKYDITSDEDGNLILNKNFDKKEQDFSSLDYKDKNTSAERNERENTHQKNYGTHDNSSTRMNDVADVAWQAERALTGTQQLSQDVESSVQKTGELIKESAKKKMSNIKKSMSNGWENDKRRFKNWYNKYFNSPAEMQEKYNR